MGAIKRLLKLILPGPVKSWISSLLHCRDYLLERSLRSAVREQGLAGLYARLERIVPDIKRQYTRVELGGGWPTVKTRGHHAFQISLAMKAMDLVCPGASGLVIADIGDSAGTHLLYLESLYPSIKVFGVNMDPAAVERIKARGVPAVLARAEDLPSLSMEADIYLAFELLEHLNDPVDFLHSLSGMRRCRALVISVPFIRASRVGLQHLRREERRRVYAENTHMFELSPGDWGLLFRHAGWKVIYDKVYLQYPRRGPLRMMKRTWEEIDFEGSYGAVLVRDQEWSSLYADWAGPNPLRPA